MAGQAAGSIYVAVIPSFVNTAARMSSFFKTQATKLGKQFSEDLARSTKVKPVGVEVQLSKREISTLQRQLNELTKGRKAAISVDANANTKDVDAKIKEVQSRINVARAGLVGIKVDPTSAKAAVKEGERLGTQVGTKIGSAAKTAAGFGLGLAGFAVAGFAARSLRAAGDFQSSMNLLVTAGGENRKALDMISGGIKSLATTTGTSTDQLAEGMYTIEKAGIRGAKGLNVLKAASQGAKAENVDLGTMTQALTSIMASYGSKMRDPIKVTNELVAAAGASKTTMSDFAAALSTVQPIAAAAHIPFDQLGGAIATLTSHGTSAQESTVELANTIRNLQAPNAVAAKEMAQFGINSQDLAAKLSKRGLQGTIDLLTQTILGKMGPSGKILLGAFNQSKIAASDANLMFTKLPKSVQSVAQQFKDGKITLGDWRKELKLMTPANAALATQWATSQNKSKAFNDQLRTGTPQARTYISSLKKMMGGATGLNTALQLSGESSKRFTDATKEIGDAGQKSGKNISTWASTQKTFNVQLDKFKEGVQVAGIRLGNVLIPAVISIAHAFNTYALPPLKVFWKDLLQPIVTFISAHKKVFIDLGLAVLALAAAWKIAITAQKIWTFWATVSTSESAGATLAMNAWTLATKIWAGVSKVATAAMWLFNAALDGNIIAIIVIAVIALGTAFVVAYKKSATFRAIVKGALDAVKTAAMAVVHFFEALPAAIESGFHAFINFFTKTIPAAVMWFINWVASHWKIAIFVAPMLVIIIEITKHWQGFVNFFKSAWNVIVGIVRTAVNVLRIIGTIIYAVLALPVVLALRAMQFMFRAVWGWIGPYVKGALLIVSGIIRTTLGVISAIWHAAWTGIKFIAEWVWKGIYLFFKVQWIALKTLAILQFKAIMAVIMFFWNGLKGPIKATWRWISSLLTGAWRWLRQTTSEAWHVATHEIISIWNSIEKPLKAAWNRISGWITRQWRALKGSASHWWGIIAGAITDAMGGIGKGLQKAWDGVKTGFIDAINIVITIIDKFLDLIHSVPGVPHWHINKISTGGGGSKGGGGGGAGRPIRATSAANGAILPGFTPGRDVHHFFSPTGGYLGLSGGESVMRPEFTQAMGAGRVHAINDAARTGGPQAVAEALGLPAQHHLFGGIISDVGKFASYVGSKGVAGAEAANPVHLAEKVYHAAVGLAEKGANALLSALPGGGLAKQMGAGILHAIESAVLHGGDSDIKKKIVDGSAVGGGSILAYAKKFIGTPYVWGGSEPGGFDCSGLVQYVLNHFGIHAPRTAASQQGWASPESQGAALPGDQVFWGKPAHHTAFYYGNNKILEAPQTGELVKIANLYGSPTFGRDPGVGSLLGGVGGVPLGGGGNPSANRTLGKRIAASMGFAKQWDSIDYVFSHESSWSNTAQNPKSTAYGIPQFINATWGKYGGKTSNAGQQIKDGIRYMVDRYGSPDGAANYWSVHHNYNRGGVIPHLASGGIIPPGGTALVGEAGPEFAHSMATGGIITSAANTKKALAARTATHNARASLLATGSALVGLILRGMNGGATTSQISATTNTILGKIEKAFTGSRKSALVTWIDNENTALTRAAKARDKITSQIAAANSYATDVRGAARSNAGITSLSDTSGVNTIQAGLNQKLKQTKQFTADIKTLSRKGLSRELIGQLIDAGVDTGGPMARQLAKASGARIRQLNASQRGIDTASARLGTTAANFKFGDNASKDFVAGMVKQRSKLSHEMSLMAESFARNVRRALTMKASGTHTKATHDSGGWLMPGHPALNLTGHPEAVLTPRQWSVAERALASGGPSADAIGKAVATYMDGARLSFDKSGLVSIVNDENKRLARRVH